MLVTNTERERKRKKNKKRKQRWKNKNRLGDLGSIALNIFFFLINVER